MGGGLCSAGAGAGTPATGLLYCRGRGRGVVRERAVASRHQDEDVVSDRHGAVTPATPQPHPARLQAARGARPHSCPLSTPTRHTAPWNPPGSAPTDCSVQAAATRVSTSSSVPHQGGERCWKPQSSPPQAARVFLKIYINSSPNKGPGVPHNGTPTSSYPLLNKLDQPPSLPGCTSLGHPTTPVLGSPPLPEHSCSFCRTQLK